MKTKRKPSKSTKTFINFGAGWLKEEYNSINCTVDWKRNQKRNQKSTGVGYKMFLVPVDSTGELDEENMLEVKYFNVKEKDLTDAPEGAPTHDIYMTVED